MRQVCVTDDVSHLLLEAADGLLVPAEVHPGDAEAAEGGGLQPRVRAGLAARRLQLLRVALGGEAVLPQGQVHVPQVAVRLALTAGVADVLQDGELLKLGWKFDYDESK